MHTKNISSSLCFPSQGWLDVHPKAYAVETHPHANLAKPARGGPGHVERVAVVLRLQQPVQLAVRVVGGDDGLGECRRVALGLGAAHHPHRIQPGAGDWCSEVVGGV